MTNEEKIISMLTDIQKNVETIKSRVENSNDLPREEKLDEAAIARQLKALEGMRHLLTKEEAEELADMTPVSREEKIRRRIEAVRNFASADTPEDKAEIDAFLAYMDAEEERKRARYAVSF